MVSTYGGEGHKKSYPCLEGGGEGGSSNPQFPHFVVPLPVIIGRPLSGLVHHILSLVH